MSELKPEIKTAWVKALRGNKYKQTTRNLCRRVRKNGQDYTGHCCLGVLREIATGEKLSRDCGLKYANVLSFSIENEYAKYNDDGWTFKQIANKIVKDERI